MIDTARKWATNAKYISPEEREPSLMISRNTPKSATHGHKLLASSVQSQVTSLSEQWTCWKWEIREKGGILITTAWGSRIQNKNHAGWSEEKCQVIYTHASEPLAKRTREITIWGTSLNMSQIRKPSQYWLNNHINTGSWLRPWWQAGNPDRSQKA